MKTKIMTIILLAALMIGGNALATVNANAASLTDAEVVYSDTQAQDIALDAAGFDAQDVTNLRISDCDYDAVEAWIISFSNGQFDYTYYVDKGTGAIHSHTMTNSLH